MNTNVSTMGVGPFMLALLAAGLLLAYGVWVGRRELGMRAMWGVAGSAFLTSLLGSLLFAMLPVLLNTGSQGGGTFPWSLVRYVSVSTVVSLLLGLIPIYVAVNWMEIIRRSTGSEPH